MPNTFTAVFNGTTFTIMCRGACVATIDMAKKEKHINDVALYEEAAETLVEVFNIIRLRMPQQSNY